MKMDKLRICVHLVLVSLLFLRSETRHLSPNIEGRNDLSGLLPALINGDKESTLQEYHGLGNENTITGRYKPTREIPGGPDPKHHYTHQGKGIHER